MDNSSAAGRFEWFAVHGIELEYMIVDATSLDVLPIADQLLRTHPEETPDDVDRGDITWSNELASHVIELKTTQPVASLTDGDLRFAAEVREIQQRLQVHHARLLPSAMHPWMDPAMSLRLWPYGHQDVYRAFDRLFHCRGHGWANLQSVHLNLPYRDDSQFARLHAAIRLVLPLLPALAASSPFCEGHATGRLDHRLHVYRTNARTIPSVTGDVVPETVSTEADYRRMVLEPMYRDVEQAGGDPVLFDEFLNARGAIPRFGRGSIEIRLLDIAECPTADLAICQAVTHVVQALCQERWGGLAALQAVPTSVLAECLRASIDQADAATIADPRILRPLGWTHSRSPTLAELWHHLLIENQLMPVQPRYRQALSNILQHGPLARRLINVCGAYPDRQQMQSVFRDLADCLIDNRQFLGG